MKKPLFLLILLHSLLLGACSAKDAPQNAVHGKLSMVDHSWLALTQRLQRDGFEKERLDQLFSRMDTPPSLRPMGSKIKELYTLKFMSRPAPKSAKKAPAANRLGIPGPWFKGVVTEANARLCQEFIKSNSKAFALAQKKYGVPAPVGAALLFVETRLGKLTGRENAFYTLASMSSKFPVENVLGYVDGIPGAEQRQDWVGARMDEKSEWAYKELKALLAYCEANGIDPHSIPGSAYGAIGMCQFMPSNISRFAEDGNGDGVIDLFTPADAILSLSRYLSLHGWRAGMPLKGQVNALMRYNKMLKYAHTILALAKTIENLDKAPAKSKRGTVKKSTAAKKQQARKAKKAGLDSRKTAPRQKRWVSAKGRDVTPYLD